jgi:hypothetical protein
MHDASPKMEPHSLHQPSEQTFSCSYIKHFLLHTQLQVKSQVLLQAPTQPLLSMPASAGRVRMPHNNRMTTSASLKTTGIWSNVIGHDPYAAQGEGEGPSAEEAAQEAEKAKKVMEMARTQNLTDGANRDDFARKMYLGLKRGKRHRADVENAAAMQQQSATLKDASSDDDEDEEDEFIHVAETKEVAETKDPESKKKHKKDQKRKSKKKRKKSRDDSSDDDDSSNDSSSSEEDRRKRRKKDKRKKRKHKRSRKHYSSSSDSEDEDEDKRRKQKKSRRNEN